MKKQKHFSALLVDADNHPITWIGCFTRKPSFFRHACEEYMSGYPGSKIAQVRVSQKFSALFN